MWLRRVDYFLLSSFAFLKTLSWNNFVLSQGRFPGALIFLLALQTQPQPALHGLEVIQESCRQYPCSHMLIWCLPFPQHHDSVPSSLTWDLLISSCPCWRIASLPDFSCLHVPCSCPDWTPNLPFGSGTLFISRPFFPIYQDLFWIALLPFSELLTLPGSVCSEHLMLIFFISLALTISLNRAGPRTNPRGAHPASLSILTADNLPRQSSQYRYTFLHGPFIRLPHSERSPLEVWGVV